MIFFVLGAAACEQSAESTLGYPNITESAITIDASSPAAPGGAPNVNAPHAPAAACKTCHATIFAQWAQSMHAYAMKSPLTVAQTNLAVKIGLVADPAPETKRVCVNCHGPIAALETASATLPVAGGDAANEGVTCVACHAMSGPVAAGGGSGALLAKIEPGRLYRGAFGDPKINSFHQSQASPLFENADTLCGSCHNVHVDRDRNGRAVKGTDLVLQTTFDEYGEYLRIGGSKTCAQCHMPAVPGLVRAVDNDPSAPPREVHDHSFVGVDYPLDRPTDPQAPRRQALLRSAASLAIMGSPTLQGGQLRFQVAVQNNSGHDLPTGFAFARQMWLEVQASAFGRTVFASGVLARASDDLCDASTLQDGLAGSVRGCVAIDPQLVNIQLKLVDRVAPEIDNAGRAKINERGELVLTQASGALETPIQFLTGGPIARKRPSTGEALTPIRPAERVRVFGYAVPIGAAATGGTGVLRVRLLFRNLAPYFVRAMAASQDKADPVQLANVVDRLEIVEMAQTQVAF